ncbi:MAG: hypothetical protein C0490_06520 [Marivirga sp.]|nr:hypothetical protein [Marivirga sp.]
MSSHHFVKEGQEPALFIIDAISFDIAGPLLEWAPLVLVAENALDSTLQWGIKIDVVLAVDSNVNKLTKELVDQAPIKILSHHPGESCLVNGLHFLISSKHSHVNVLASPGDAVFMHLENFTHSLQVSLIDDHLKWSAITSGKFEKWVEANTKFQLRKNSASQEILIDGLKPTNGELESTTAGLITMRSEKPFWVAERHL